MKRVTADQIYPFQLRCWERSLSLPQPRDLYVFQRSKKHETRSLKTLAFIWQTFLFLNPRNTIVLLIDRHSWEKKINS